MRFGKQTQEIGYLLSVGFHRMLVFQCWKSGEESELLSFNVGKLLFLSTLSGVDNRCTFL